MTRTLQSGALFKGLVTLRYKGRFNGMQLKKVVRVKSHDTHVKMEGRGLFCAACRDFKQRAALRHVVYLRVWLRETR